MWLSAAAKFGPRPNGLLVLYASRNHATQPEDFLFCIPFADVLNPSLFYFLVSLMAAPSSRDTEKRLYAGNAQAVALEYEASFHTLQSLVVELSDEDPVMVPARLSAGCVAVALGKDELARLHFLWVLKRNPDTPLTGPDSDSRRLQAFFGALREEALRVRADNIYSASATPTLPGNNEDTALEKNESVMWLGQAGASAVGGAVTFTSVLMVLINDMVVANPNQPAHVRQEAQETGRIWLGLGLSSLALSLLGVGGAIWLAPKSE